MERNRYIDYLKAVGIIFVVITHNNVPDPTRKILFFPFWISMAVPLFILISGINFSNSIEHRGIRTLKGWYGIGNLFSRLTRFMLPFTLVYVFEVFWRITRKGVKYSVWSFIKDFLEGGYGSGSYYVCIMLQLIVIFPICYFIIKENYKLGIPLLISLHLLFEFAVHYYPVDQSYYRLSIFRYLAFIALGIFIYLRRKENKPISNTFLIISFLYGFSYLLSAGYLHYKVTLFTYWVTTALPSAFYVFPLVYLIIGIKGKKDQSEAGKYLALIGKASYHIFLTQMLYYYLQLDEKFNYPLTIMISILICTNVGILFYLIDTKWMTGNINKLLEQHLLKTKSLNA